MNKLSLFGTCIAAACLNQVVFAKDGLLPWGQPSDMGEWESFAQITAAANNPSVNKVEFETWASDDDIYAKSPAQWPSVGAPKVLRPSALAHAMNNSFKVQVFEPGQCNTPNGLPPPNGDGAAAGSGFPGDACIGEEVRRNWASFQYIVSNGLDSRGGLSKAFAAGLKVDLPADAVEFKGDWAKVTDVARWLKIDPTVVRSNYYTSITTSNGTKTEVALLSFHISTKQIKNWVWSDFEGAMNPGRCDVIGCNDSFGGVTAKVQPNTAPYQSYGGCAKSTALKSMLDSAGTGVIWFNYCLKGSQITFVDDAGKATLLGISVIEPLNAGVDIAKSSCITCHGYASFDKNGGFHSITSATGNLLPSNLTGYVSNDFIWGISVSNIKQ